VHEKGDFQYGCLLNIGVRMGVFGCFKIQRNILQNSAQIKEINLKMRYQLLYFYW